MKHLGDITKINGAEIPIVDCITGGSPCQDLSVAGKRAGLSGERSGLFMEQLRIVKEMRKRDQEENGRTDQFIRPRFMVWENVPGAFSSNNGKDFQAVLTEIVRIVEPDAPDVPMPDKGKWTKSGCIYDEMGRWSVAWRVHDAQFWGVPQRRQRIALVADFGGLAAPEVQFERKGVSGYSEPSGETRKGATKATGSGVDCTSICVHLLQDPVSMIEKTPCISGGSSDHGQAMVGVLQEESREQRERTAGAVGSGIESASLFDAYQHHGWRESDTCGPLTVGQNNTVRGDTPLVASANGFGGYSMGAGTLRAAGGDNGGGSEMLAMNTSTVRRLTPLECERLQGFPDGWTDIGKWTDTKGKKHQTADSSRYKALGNSIALPYWFRLLRRISAVYDRPATLGSLFDGIGGFPLCWERCNGVGTAIWASEIEEFPIAVTKRHFPERGDAE